MADMYWGHVVVTRNLTPILTAPDRLSPSRYVGIYLFSCTFLEETSERLPLPAASAMVSVLDEALA